MKDEFFGLTVVLSEDVQYIGSGQDPAEDPYFMAHVEAWKKMWEEMKRNGILWS